ncbi:V4R domain-containing protein [Methanocaldococcus indicus]|uniref:V4R domain-containing protein n=1 Tax=Methanocaldococcus indicus TaxID=213231 RepID=UPI003C6D9BBF
MKVSINISSKKDYEIYKTLFVEDKKEIPNDKYLIDDALKYLRKYYDKNKMQFRRKRKKRATIPVELFKIFVLTTYNKLKNCGSEITLYDLGYEFGKSLDIKTFRELKKFFSVNNLGKVKIIKRKPLTIKIEECAFCEDIEKDEPICYFDAGLLAGIIENILNKKVVVDEVKCMAQGYDGCYFEVEEIKE